MGLIVGLDEVGRGCWAGPLVAAAVVLSPNLVIPGLNDSKKLTKSQRRVLSVAIHGSAAAAGIGWVSSAVIDSLGLTVAVGLAMQAAITQVIQSIGETPSSILIDGNYNFLPMYSGVTTIVRGDGSIPEISAASIIAKVARDNFMADAANKYPNYGFEKHVGYGTAQHNAALRTYGVTPLHRMSFKPVRAVQLVRIQKRG